MVTRNEIRKITDVLWEIPKGTRKDMLVSARFFASESMIPELLQDRSLIQLVNVTTLPGIVGRAYAMPDMHEGYGFPIGGIAATGYPNGVISPGGIGYDINCGVRLLRSELSYKDIRKYIQPLAHTLSLSIPSGVGRSGIFRLRKEELDDVLSQGAAWSVSKGYGEKHDLTYIESQGTIQGGDPSYVSHIAKERGKDQLGTLGAGNHFIEVGYVDAVFEKEIAQAFGLFLHQITILIHTGSRGFGHQVATDYIKTMMASMSKYNIIIPDRELACAPFSSPEGARYFQAMACAANFAFANRQMISWEVRRAWLEVLGKNTGSLTVLYDVAHNIAKIEKHTINGKKQDVIVHRKGATRAFPTGHPDIPMQYQSCGQPVLIPGSMGTSSYVLVGTKGAMEESLGSACHGAGRRMSRKAAQKSIDPHKLKQSLNAKGITIEAGSYRGLAEEAPQAYKDIHNIVDVVARAGIAKKVVRLQPVIVVKG